MIRYTISRGKNGKYEVRRGQNYSTLKGCLMRMHLRWVFRLSKTLTARVIIETSLLFVKGDSLFSFFFLWYEVGRSRPRLDYPLDLNRNFNPSLGRQKLLASGLRTVHWIRSISESPMIRVSVKAALSLQTISKLVFQLWNCGRHFKSLFYQD